MIPVSLSRLIRDDTLHFPVERGKYRLALWAYVHLPKPREQVLAEETLLNHNGTAQRLR